MGLDSFAGGQSFDCVLQSEVCPRELFIPFFKFFGCRTFRLYCCSREEREQEHMFAPVSDVPPREKFEKEHVCKADHRASEKFEYEHVCWRCSCMQRR